MTETITRGFLPDADEPAARRSGIGGGDAAAILGIDRYRTAHDVYLAKIGEGPEDEWNEAMKWGETLEPIVRAAYVARTGRSVTETPGIIVHESLPWMQGHLDGLVLPGDAPDAPRVLEIKVARSAWDWADPEEHPDGIPVYHRPQVQHYLAVTGYPVADVAVLLGGIEMRIYTVAANPVAQALMIEVERRFWEENVQRRVPPELDGTEGASRMLSRLYPRDDGTELVALPHQYGPIERLLAARQAIAAAEAEERAAEQVIKEAMGPATTLLAPAATISWKRTRDSTRTDWKLAAGDLHRLAVELGAEKMADFLVSVHTGAREGVRRFTVKPKEDDLGSNSNTAIGDGRADNREPRIGEGAGEPTGAPGGAGGVSQDL